ncbi:MAG: metalloregulator ArsR/SmtB family transcription factor [Stagnimonas sp.]|nr:metalloregulator ArsR/SmtB family transcription factor [Stagnimonas sp.]
MAQAPERKAAEMVRHAEAAARLLRALANPHRLLLLCTLAEGERSVGELNQSVPLSQSALSQHLALLREDELVLTRREAQTIYYSLAKGPALTVINALHSVYCKAG